MPSLDVSRQIFLSSDGAGGGTVNWNGDYSSAQGRAYYAPLAGEARAVIRMMVSIEDTTGMSAAEYGNIGSALSNGIHIHARSQGVVFDMTPALIKQNADWSTYCYDAELKSWGVGNELLAVRWTFTRDGAPLWLFGDNSDYLEVLMDDDLTGLVKHYFLIKVVEPGTVVSEYAYEAPPVETEVSSTPVTGSVTRTTSSLKTVDI